MCIIFLIILTKIEPKHLQEIASGYGFGAVSYSIGVNLFGKIAKKEAYIFGNAFYTIGTSYGVWLVGKKYDGGKFLPTLIGTISIYLILNSAKNVMKISSPTVDEFIGFSFPFYAFLSYNLLK